MPRLERQVAFLTGAGAGIGRATALAFAREGARIAVVDLDGDAARATAAMARQHTDDVICVQADLTDEDAVRRAIDGTAEHFGRLDILFNCAGGSATADGLIHEMPLPVWQHTVALNLLNPFLCCKHALPHMLREQAGNIVNVSSHVSLVASARPVYSAAKGGLNALTRSLAAQYSAAGIRANAIACGTIRSQRLLNEQSRAAGGPGADEAGVKSLNAERAALRKLYPWSVGDPEDVAAVALFLASGESRMINGAVVAAEGGRSAYLRVLPASDSDHIPLH